jgi:hypothetical protein
MTPSAIKRRLSAHGFWPKGWPLNNGMGPLTRAQIKKFQRAHGLEPSGIVGPKTTKALNAPNTRKAPGERARAVNWAKSRIGVVEHPAGSNQGPLITQWQELSGYPGGGVAWCQCFVNASAYVGSRKRIKPNWFAGYTPSVVEMADRGEHGLKRIKLEDARPGDWLYFNWPGGDFVDHVGLFMHRDGDSVHTIEGNTSSGNDTSGSQSNGGGVFARVRDRSLIAAVVRPPFKS